MLDVERIVQFIGQYKRRYPVRIERTHERDLEMSAWIRQFGRPSKSNAIYDGVEIGCMTVTDIDWCFLDYQRKVIQIVEVKTRGAQVRFAQANILKAIDTIMSAGAPLSGYSYLGCHILRMQNTTPSNSEWIEWDGSRISKEECWLRLNMLYA